MGRDVTPAQSSIALNAVRTFSSRLMRLRNAPALHLLR